MKETHKNVIYGLIFFGIFFGFFYINNPGENEIWKPEEYSITNEYKIVNGKSVYIPESPHKISGWYNDFEKFKKTFENENVSITAFQNGEVVYSVKINNKIYYTKKNFIKDSDLFAKEIAEKENIIVLYEKRNMPSQLMFGMLYSILSIVMLDRFFLRNIVNK